MYFVFNTSPN